MRLVVPFTTRQEGTLTPLVRTSSIYFKIMYQSVRLRPDYDMAPLKTDEQYGTVMRLAPSTTRSQGRTVRPTNLAGDGSSPVPFAF
jgi:hypothetical protein